MAHKAITAIKFPLTTVTCEPCAFIVCLQQMHLELAAMCKAVWTVMAWKGLCIGVSINMKLQMIVCFKWLTAMMTDMRFFVAVCMPSMLLQVAAIAKTTVTQWTLVRFVSRVDSDVSLQISRLTKCLVTCGTFVWFLSTVNSAVLDKRS